MYLIGFYCGREWQYFFSLLMQQVSVVHSWGNDWLAVKSLESGLQVNSVPAFVGMSVLWHGNSIQSAEQGVFSPLYLSACLSINLHVYLSINLYVYLSSNLFSGDAFQFEEKISRRIKNKDTLVSFSLSPAKKRQDNKLGVFPKTVWAQMTFVI